MAALLLSCLACAVGAPDAIKSTIMTGELVVLAVDGRVSL